MSQVDCKKILEFLELVSRLKHMKRTGWVIKGLNECETISGHMYRMAVMTFLLNDINGIDKNKCMQLAIVHDLAECIVGDITPHCGITPEDKHRMEDEAMKDITDMVGSSGKEIYTLYKEYESGSTPEGKFVKQLDKFELLLQALEYEKKDNTPKRYQEFFDNTRGMITHPFLTNLLEEVHTQRNNVKKEEHINHGQ